MGTELKPCPFCGSGVERIKIHEASAPFVRCLECWGECCPDGWDTRPGEDAATARAEAAEQRAEAAEAALAAARAEVAQAEVARAGGKAKIRYLERELGRVETYWRKRLWGAQ